jgi:hypothetical protein
MTERPGFPDGHHVEIRRHRWLSSTFRPAVSEAEAAVFAEARAAADAGPVRHRDHVPRSRRTRPPEHDGGDDGPNSA